MRILYPASLAVLALAACQKAPPAAPASGAPAPASAAAGPLAAQDLPHRKPGLWRQTMTMEGAPSGMPATSICVDEASEAKMSVIGRQTAADAKCDPPKISRGLDGALSYSSHCDMGAMGQSDSQGTITGDFNSQYQVVIDTKVSGASTAEMNGEHKMTITAAWTGPCAPGQKGGDIILPNGMKMNMAGGPPG